MTKHQYRQYIKRALINSVLAVLSAAAVVLIVVYGYQAFQMVVDRIMDNGSGAEEELSRLELLESLRGGSDVSEAEKERMLEELRSPDAESISAEEKLRLLESLKQP